MNPLMTVKFNELKGAQDYSCWYLVKQPTDFASLCYLVDTLNKYKERFRPQNLETFLGSEIQDINNKRGLSISTNYRALRVAAFFGLIIMTDSAYVNAQITDSFFEIKKRCGGQFENVAMYQDIIDRQLEKMFISSSIDEGYKNVRSKYRLYPVMYLYKVLLEIGKASGKYSISMDEYRYLVATSERYEDFLKTLLLITMARSDSSLNEFTQFKAKFDNRMNQALMQISTLDFSNDRITIVADRLEEVKEKVFLFESNPLMHSENGYLTFLGSVLPLIEQKKVGEPSKPDNEAGFKKWLSEKVRENGEYYSVATQGQYVSALKSIAKDFPSVLGLFISVFAVDNVQTLDSTVEEIKSSANYETVNVARGNGSLSAGLGLYRQYLIEKNADKKNPIRYITGIDTDKPRNQIIFGAPGTGKSFTINQEKDDLISHGGEYERVTFHPDYSHAHFVGSYKPVPSTDSEGKEIITYSFVPGPFMRTYVKAIRNSRTEQPLPYLLIIEEINRANVAAVFGDVFQLLDRNDDEISEYPIQISEDIKKYLAKELGGSPEDYCELCLPDNMFIWATMNSADQGVFPMDTAFKRRWDFHYISIDKNAAEIENKWVYLGKGANMKLIEWNSLRKSINNFMAGNLRINEDKLIGPYFISKKVLSNWSIDKATGKAVVDSDVFESVFANKVLMYLFDDAAKQKRAALFGGMTSATKYSDVVAEFSERGVAIFASEISSQF